MTPNIADCPVEPSGGSRECRDANAMPTPCGERGVSLRSTNASPQRVLRIEDLAGPAEIGRIYNVPTILVPGRNAWSELFSGVAVPIIGPLHEDAEFIGFKDQHWHVDWRFVSARVFARLPRHSIRPPLIFQASKVITETMTVGAILRARRKCRREPLHFPDRFTDSGFLENRREIPWLRALELAFAGHSAKCGVCPHRGISLAGQPIVDGARVCPGHGLRWDATTGSLAPRMAQIEREVEKPPS